MLKFLTYLKRSYWAGLLKRRKMSTAVSLTPDLAQQVIYNQLRTDNIPDPLSKLVTAQSGHETGGWTSNVYKTLNNAFGYGYNGSTYKDYDSVEESAHEISLYLNRRVNEGSFPPLDQITDAGQYATLLKNAGYYSDNSDNYSAGISRWFNNNLQIAAGISVAAVVGIGLFVYFLLKK